MGSAKGDCGLNLRQMRWPVVLAALVIALAGLFGTDHLVKSKTVDQPLQQALAGVDGLASYQLQRVGGKQEISVRLAPAADLKETYTAVDQQVQQILQTAPYLIRVEDQRSEDFARVANRLDLFVQEGVSTGQFAEMAERVEAEAVSLGAEAQVAVDGERVYLSLRKGDDYLHSVVERPQYPTPLVVEGGMGQ